MKKETKSIIIISLLMFNNGMFICLPSYNFKMGQPVKINTPYWCSPDYHQEVFENDHCPVITEVTRSAVITIPETSIAM